MFHCVKDTDSNLRRAKPNISAVWFILCGRRTAVYSMFVLQLTKISTIVNAIADDEFTMHNTWTSARRSHHMMRSPYLVVTFLTFLKKLTKYTFLQIFIFSDVGIFLTSWCVPLQYSESICGLCCQKQVSEAGISNYIPQKTVGCNYL